MEGRKSRPGISRERRIGDEGLLRLEAQLERGARPSDVVLRQWLKRYGDAAGELLVRYGFSLPDENE